jgi:Flp pilus assembly protein TadG
MYDKYLSGPVSAGGGRHSEEFNRIHNEQQVSKMQASTTKRQRGQVLVLVVLGLTVFLAMVALVIDGGFAFTQQRATQNGADASAEAGALVLAQNLAGGTNGDTEVRDAVYDIAAANEVVIVSAEYTDVTGAGLGTAVGSGSIPSGAAGVRANAQRTFNTLIASVVGLTTFTADTSATAVAGFKSTTCDVTQGCALLPVTPPISQTTCDGSNNAVPVSPAAEWSTIAVSIIPLCSSGNGNVGWIDWDFAYGGSPNGGTDATIASTITADNPAIIFPTWIQISQAGTTNSQDLENAINRYKGQAVLIPMFEHTCGSDPVPPYDVVGDGTAGCLTNLDNGNGTKMWYYLKDIKSLLLCGPGIDLCDAVSPPFVQGAYINGNNPVCDTGNGATGCLVGIFSAGYVSPGSIDANFPGGGGPSDNAGISVQLIR